MTASEWLSSADSAAMLLWMRRPRGPFDDSAVRAAVRALPKSIVMPSAAACM